MKRILLFFLTILTSIVLNAQEELRIKSFLPSINDLTARTNIRKDFAGIPCALVKVSIADSGVTFECGNVASMIVGNVAFHTNEYWVYMVAGTNGAKHLKVKHPLFPTLDVVFADYGFGTLESQTTYSLVIVKPHKESKYKKTSLFFQPYGQIGTFNSAGIAIGGFLHNFNLESFCGFGLVDSEEIFWISSENTGSSASYSYTYNTLKTGGKIGYGIRIGERFRMTPQVGISTLLLNGKEIAIGENNPNAKHGYATNLDVSIRSDVYIAKHFTLSIIPEYSLAMKKSDLYERVSNVSTKVNSFATGYNLRFGLTFN